MTLWAICKNRLLPNSPKWTDSENFLVRRNIKVLFDKYFDLANKTETPSMSLYLFIWGPIELRLIQ